MTTSTGVADRVVREVVHEVVPGGLAALPGVNTRVTVSPMSPVSRLDGEAPGAAPEVPSLVEDLRLEVAGRGPASAELVVAQPLFDGNLVGETPGTPYLVRWVTDRGVHEVTGRFLSRERIGPALIGWRLRVKGPVSRIQRRAHARVDLAVPVEVVVLDDADDAPERLGVLRGTTVNLSEGGVLARLDGPAAAVGSAVMVRFGLGGESFVLAGRVVRHQAASGVGRGARPATAIAFDTPDAHGDRMRPLLFAHQLQARRLGVA